MPRPRQASCRRSHRGYLRSGARRRASGSPPALLPRWLRAARLLMRWLTPARRRGFEILDDPSTPPEVREQSLGDVARSNSWLGGARAMLVELNSILRE